MKIRLLTDNLRHGSPTVLVLAIILVAISNQNVDGERNKYSDDCISVNKEFGKCVPLQTCPLFLGWIRQRPIVKSNIKLVVQYTCFFDLENPKVCCPKKDIDPDGNILADKSSFNDVRQVPKTRRPGIWFDQRETTNRPDIIFPSDNLQPETLKKQPRAKNLEKFQLIPKLKDCSKAVKLDRLFGTYGTHPWIALIGYKERVTGKFYNLCSGTIINRRYILTSAHCPYEGGQLITYVRLGEYNLDTDTDRGSNFLPPSNYIEYKIEKIIPHLRFQKTSRNNDIALIRLEKDIDFTTVFIKPICLPFPEYGLSAVLEADDLNGLIDRKALVAGWGKTTWNAQGISRNLQDAPVQFSPYNECENAYGKKKIEIQYKQFCIGGKRRENSCVVDSGGPLLLPVPINATRPGGFSTPKIFQLGIYSYGPSSEQCREPYTPPSIYTKVYSYLEWILNTLEP